MAPIRMLGTFAIAHRLRDIGVLGMLLGVSILAAPVAVMAQEDPSGAPLASPERESGSRDGGDADAQPAESARGSGFWAGFAHSTPLGLSTQPPSEAGLWSRTGEGFKRVWSDGRPNLIVSGYAWHLPWKHTSERQKAFNDAAWGLGFGRSFAENDRRQRIVYVLASKDSHQRMQYMTGYGWQALWRPSGAWRFGLGYTMLLIGRQEYNYIPLPLMLPAFSVGVDSAELYGAYVPYGEVILLLGRFTF